MAAPQVKKAIGNSASTTLSSSISNSATSAPLTSDTNFSAESGEGMVILDEGTASAEFAYSTGKTGSSLDIPLANRGLEGGSALAHNSGATVKGIITAGMWNDFTDSYLAEHNDAGTHKELVTLKGTSSSSAEIRLSEDTDNGTNYMGIKAPSAVTSSVTLTLPDGAGSAGQALTTDGSGTLSWASAGILSTTQYAPEGFLINGKIVPSVASNNLTVAIKGMDGNDPSASNPVYVRIDNTVRTITSALSVTKNAGTNWFNAGSSELATYAIDYFVYLGYNATDGVTIGFSRIPYANIYSDFSTTTTNEKYCAISTIASAVAGDNYVVIGRFEATLSAGAGYTWTVPTFTATNLIQRPIYETRQLLSVGTLSSAGTLPVFGLYNAVSYKLVGNYVYFNAVKINTSGGTAGSGANQISIALPFAISTRRHCLFGFYTNGSSFGININGQGVETQSTVALRKSGSALNCADLNDANTREISLDGYYEI